MAILDQWGSPLATSPKFLKAAENGGGRVPPEHLRLLDPLRKLVSYRDWQTVSFLSDKLFANFGVVEGAISQKSMFAVGSAWKPVFLGEATAWGAEARRWLIEEWYPSCDIRGLNYDFTTNLYQQSVNIDRAGDSIEVLLESENGWPQVQTIPSRQIGNWETTSGLDEEIKDGPYAGLILRNGVIMTRQERPVAYRHLGEKPGDFEDIPARFIIHCMEPKWSDQARGFPIFSSCIEDFRAIAQSEEWERQAMLIASSIGLLEWNEDGAPEANDEDPLGANVVDDEGKPTGLRTQTIWGGLYRYLKSDSGRLEQFVSNRPSAEWTEFQDRHIRKALCAANWPYSWAWKPESANGTAQRTENVKARGSVTDRQQLLAPTAARKIRFAVSVAIKNKMLPPYPGRDKGGFLKWGFTLPPRVSIDEGRDRQQRREDSKFGLILDSKIVEEDGDTTYPDFCLQRARDIATRELARRQIEKETGVPIDPREMKMLGANDQPQAIEPDDDDEPSRK